MYIFTQVKSIPDRRRWSFTREKHLNKIINLIKIQLKWTNPNLYSVFSALERTVSSLPLTCVFHLKHVLIKLRFKAARGIFFRQKLVLMHCLVWGQYDDRCLRLLFHRGTFFFFNCFKEVTRPLGRYIIKGFLKLSDFRFRFRLDANVHRVIIVAKS